MRNRALREFKDGKMKLGPDGLIPVRWIFRPHFSSTLFECESYFTFTCYMLYMFSEKPPCAFDPSLSPSKHGQPDKFCGVELRQCGEPVQVGLSLLHPLDKALP